MSKGYNYGNVTIIGGGAQIALDCAWQMPPLSLSSLCSAAKKRRCSLMGAMPHGEAFTIILERQEKQ